MLIYVLTSIVEPAGLIRRILILRLTKIYKYSFNFLSLDYLSNLV